MISQGVGDFGCYIAYKEDNHYHIHFLRRGFEYVRSRQALRYNVLNLWVSESLDPTFKALEKSVYVFRFLRKSYE